MAGKVVKATTHDGDNLLQCGYPVAAACSQNEESQLRAFIRRKERRLKLYRMLLWRYQRVHGGLLPLEARGSTESIHVHARIHVGKERRTRTKKREDEEEKDESGERTRRRDRDG